MKAIRIANNSDSNQSNVTADVLAVIDAALTFCKVVVEYGSGDHTISIGQRLSGWGRLISIEHNRENYEITQEALSKVNLPVTHILSEILSSQIPDESSRSSPSQLNHYVEEPSKHLHNEKADLVLVQGQEKDKCASHAVNLLASSAESVGETSSNSFRWRAFP